MNNEPLFFSGLPLIVLGVVTLIMRRSVTKHYTWLALFALTLGASQLLHPGSLGRGAGHSWSWILFVASWVPLVELVRRSVKARLDETHAGQDRALRAIADATPDWIFAKDLEHRLIMVNRSFAESQNLRPEQMIGHRDTDFWSSELCEGNPETGARGFHDEDRRAFRGEAVRNENEIATLHDGTQRIFDAQKEPLRDGDGKIIGAIAYFRDVTEQRRAETTLRESEERFRAVFEQVAVGMAIGDLEGRIVHINDRFCSMLGYSKEELVELGPEGSTHPDDVEEDARLFSRLLTGELPSYRVEKRYLHKNGQAVWAALTVTPRRVDGRIVEVVGVAEDITARKEAEQALSRVTDRLQAAQKLAHVGDYTLSFVSGELYWSRQIFNMMGLDPTEFEPTVEAFMNLVHPEDRERVKGTIESAAAKSYTPDEDGRTQLPSLEYRVLRPDGSTRWMHTEAAAELDNHGRPMLVHGTLHDVTARRDAEDQLRENESLLRTIFDVGEDRILLIDSKGTVLAHNRATAEHYGGTSIKGKDIFSLAPKSVAALRRKKLEAALTSREPVRYEDVNDGRYADAVVSPVMDASGDAHSAVVFARDITSRKETENALRESLREKETLLREVHHRVKNNLQIMSSILYFQARKTGDAKQLEVIDETRTRLNSLILVHEKLYQSSSLSRIVFGDYLKDLVTELVNSYQDRGPRILLDVDAPFELPIETALPYGMILSELVTNVYKHAASEEGRDIAEVRVWSSDDALSLSVVDHGPGIPSDVDLSNPVSFGWRLVQNLARQVGAEISVASDSGTSVTVSSPICKAADS